MVKEYRKFLYSYFLILEVHRMFKVGDTVKWMCPLDHDYMYGVIVGIKRGIATVHGIGLYSGVTSEVHFKYIKRVQIGGGSCGGCDKKSYK